jgi:hypothetical protein
MLVLVVLFQLFVDEHYFSFPLAIIEATKNPKVNPITSDIIIPTIIYF